VRAFVRQAVGLSLEEEDVPNIPAQLRDHEERIARLEEAVIALGLGA
jgi:hypothetical protein